MIARVRIAPVERWCEQANALLKKAAIPGTKPVGGEIIEIETASMRPSTISCGGNEWRVVAVPGNVVGVNPETLKQVNPLDGEGWICEHMLEMD
jgi:hypothetical protein